MKKLTKVIMSGAAVAAIGASMAFGFTACGGGDGLKGTITIEGSTSVQPLMQKLADAYMAEHDGVTISVGGGGSGVGVSKAKDGTVDLGMASKKIEGDDATGITAIQIATDGIALIASKNCTVTNVTKSEVYELYVNHTAIQGIITDAISRDGTSGTREAFQDIMDIETLYENQPELQSQDTVIQEVGNKTNVIGYCSLEALAVNDTIKGLNFEGVAPTAENVSSGAYTLSRPFNIMYNTEKGMNELTADFVDFIFSSAAAAIIEANGQVVVARK